MNGKKIWLAAVLMVCLAVWADEETIDYFALSLERLMEIPVVESSSRQAELWQLTSVPVSIISAEDIHYSGLTKLGDMLQFAPGIDYLKVDNNREMIGIRGFQDAFSDKTLLLIDGRSAENPGFGGFELRRLPILIEDIERIEVVRGPVSAAWGANAVNGVINIITKDPKDTLGLTSSVMLDENGNSYSFARWGEQDGNLSYRLSVGYSEGQESGGREWLEYKAIPLPGLTPSPRVARDFYRDSVLDSLFVYEPSDETKVSFGLSLSRREEGDFSFHAYQPMKDGRLDTARSFLRLEQELDDGQSFSLQWAGRFEDSTYPSLLKSKIHENDFEAQYSREDENNKLTVGANARFARIEAGKVDAVNFIELTKAPYDEIWLGLFVVDRWQVMDRFAIEGQLRGDSYNETGEDWSGRLSGLLSLDDEDRHVVVLSAARAFRAPAAVWRDLQMERWSTLFGGIPVPFNTPADDLDNEHITSYELGYTALLSSNATFRVNGYYQSYEDLIVYVDPPPTLSAPHYENELEATATGAEIEFELKGEPGRILLWGGYNEMNRGTLGPNSFTLLGDPAEFKAGLSGWLHLPEQCVLSVHYKYSGNPDLHYKGSDIDWPASHRVDAALSKSFFNGKAELLIGVSDILNETRDPVTENYHGTPAHETQGRTFFVRVGMNF
jgi:iron complex outermembrane receptor protein